MADKAAFTDYFLNLCDEVMNLYYLGLNAAVYTQITDVEIEKNGFLTYDRKVLKTDEPEKVNARLAELIDMPKSKLLIKPIISAGNKHHYDWRYTVEAEVPANWHAIDFDDTAWATGYTAFGQNMGSADSYIGTKCTTNDITARRWYKLGDISPENIDKPAPDTFPR